MKHSSNATKKRNEESNPPSKVVLWFVIIAILALLAPYVWPRFGESHEETIQDNLTIGSTEERINSNSGDLDNILKER